MQTWGDFFWGPPLENSTNLKLQTHLVAQVHMEKAKQHLFFFLKIFEYSERSAKLLVI